MNYQALLPLRPTTVMHQLGVESTVPLLNGRFVLDALAESFSVLWAPRTHRSATAQALARAATHLKAAVGFVLAPDSLDPGEMRLQYAPGACFRAVVEAAERMANVSPFFLHAQLPPVAEPRGADFLAAASHLSNCLEAGFTSFGVDLTQCPIGEQAALAGGLLSAVLELELCVVVRLPAPGRGEAQASAVAAMVAALRSEGIGPDLVLLPDPGEIGEEAFPLVEAVAPLIAPTGVAWTRLPRDFRERFLVQEEPLVKAILGDDSLETLAAGREGGIDPETLEALAYMEALDRLEALRGKDTAAFLLQALETS